MTRMKCDYHNRKATEGVECRKDAGVIDEMTMAYNNIDAVMAARSDLADVVHALKQVVWVRHGSVDASGIRGTNWSNGPIRASNAGAQATASGSTGRKASQFLPPGAAKTRIDLRGRPPHTLNNRRFSRSYDPPHSPVGCLCRAGRLFRAGWHVAG
jgi:hypothetical protein